MWKWLRRITLGLLAGTGLAAIAGAVLLLNLIKGEIGDTQPLPVPNTTVLYLDFSDAIISAPQTSTLHTLFNQHQIDIYTLTDTIRRAAADPRVQGLVADISFSQTSLAYTQEILAALKLFREAGKFSYAFADTFSEGDNATGRYLLASGFDQIWMQPTGMLAILGIGAEVPFYKDTLSMLGLTADIGKRKGYKTAMNSFSENGFTPEHRDEVTTLLHGYFDIIAATILQNRKQTEPLRTLVDKSPLMADAAKKQRLIDGIGYLDEVIAMAHDKAGMTGEDTRQFLPNTTAPTENAREGWLSISDYSTRRAAPAAHTGTPDIALIFASGMILRGDVPAPLADAENMDITSLTTALHQAASDATIKAIVLRIDSPGGSYTASDTLRRAILKAKARKPVVVSMGDVAASGGYYLAMDGTKIFANPLSITGSIGVFSGKLVSGELAQKLQVKTDSISIGKNALMWSGNQPFDSAGKIALDRTLDFIYDDFTSKVAASRNIDPAAIDGIASGRVYTGSSALALNLIDATGTLHDAISAAKRLAKLTPAQSTQSTVIVLPESKDAWQELLDMLGSGDFVSATSTLMQLLSNPLVHTLATAHVQTSADAAAFLPSTYHIQ